MAKKTGFMKSVPLPVKLSLVACAVITALAGVYLISSPNSNKMLVSENAGKIDIAVTPTIKNGEDQTVESEIINEVYAEAKQEQLEEAKSGTGSYLDKIKLENDKNVAEKLVEKEKEIEEQAAIDTLLGVQNEVATQRKRNEIDEDRGRLIETHEEMDTYMPPVEIMPLFDKDAFLMQETGRKNEFLKTRQAAVANVLAVNMSGRGSSVSSRYEPSNSKGDNGMNWNDSSQGSASGAGSMANYLTDSSRLKNTVEKGKQNQMAKLDKYRADNGVKSSTYDQTTSDSSSSNNATDSVDSVINDLANPMGFTDQSSMTFITPGTIYYSVLEIGVNTDEVSHVRALIVQEGPLKGGILLGLPERRGQKAIIAFNKLSLHGREFGIDAVALDLETMRTGIADSVDNHTFERYTKLMAAAFISGYADSLSGGTTKTYSDGTTETIIERLPDTDDQIAYAIGKAGDKLVPIFEREFDRQPTIEIDSNREIAIMLLSGLQIIE
ncbi:DotG/IcmE/VirB10 family protein [Vibrio splendidus]|nr:DotG/IcmE/VirB10 family protein [Vibrio splendidus]MCC4883259.1 DotG/IcmE/VirB10 family protein [Vibrio splendidus]